MKKKPLILLGSGGHAKACIDIVESDSRFYIYGIIDNSKKSKLLGYPIIGRDKDLKKYFKKVKHLLIGVGQIRDNKIRPRLYKLGKSLGYKFPKIVSKRSYISKNSEIQEGTIIFHDVVINSATKIGKNCIINNKCLIEHDASIGNHCHISTGAIVNGEVQVGEGVFIGSGVVTKQSVSIGSRCVIGAGAIIKTDIKSNQVIKN